MARKKTNLLKKFKEEYKEKVYAEQDGIPLDNDGITYTGDPLEYANDPVYSEDQTDDLV